MNATIMPVGTLICDLTERGIKLRVERGDLRVEAPKGRVTPEVLGVLRERKPEIIKELEGLDDEIQFGRTASLYRGAKLPNRIHFEEAVRLYRERGWLQIFSAHLNQNIYLVRNQTIKVPDPSVPRYTQEETEALRDLTLDEIKTLHEAKLIFNGAIQ